MQVPLQHCSLAIVDPPDYEVTIRRYLLLAVMVGYCCILDAEHDQYLFRDPKFHYNRPG